MEREMVLAGAFEHHPGHVPGEVDDAEEPVEIKLKLETAEGAFTGPDRSRTQMWTLLFDTSYKRGDWLRPVTGWKAKPAEIAEWERVKGRRWRKEQ
jgi:hypothetical protein